MIKKAKIFGIFSTTILLPFSLLSVSCGKPKASSVVGANYSQNGNNDDNKLTISEEIKDFVKKGIMPDEDKDQSILLINDLTDSEDSRNEIKSSLNRLASKLNESDDKDKVELKDNKIVEDALKKIIYDNCKTTSQLLKTNFSSEFSELTAEKILEIDDNGLFFNLKNFGIDKILHDIGYNENEASVKIVNSQALKIYRFSTNLKITVNTNGGKKTQVDINDLNLFVVSDKNQAAMLKKGISEYLEDKFAKHTISIYLDENESGKNYNSEINEHFTEILKKKNYSLTGSDNNKKQIMFYLANKYLPKLIYQNSSQEEIPIKIDSKDLTFDLEKDNFLKDGMEMSQELEQRMNVLNFFGNEQNVRQISEETVKEIKPEDFLKHKEIHDEKYYSLGSGKFNIIAWNIKGFQIRPINIKFEIFIDCEILKKEIQNLQICLNNLLDIMSKSSANKRYFKQKFVLDITWNRTFSSSIASQLETEKSSQNTELEKLNNYLTLAYINPAKEKIKASNALSLETLKNTSFSFETNTFEEKDSSSSSNRFNEKLEIYFVFNSSFKIKISDKLLYNTLDPKIKGAAKDLRNLQEPISAVVICNSKNVADFKDGLVATLKTGDFANLSIDDIIIEKPNGNPLENKDIIWPGNSIDVKIKANPKSPYFFGETDIFTINHYFFPQRVSLTDLEEPNLVASPDHNPNSFKESLIAALRTGKFNGINRGGVNIMKENGDSLDREYIGANDSVTVKIEPHQHYIYFSGTKILKIQRLRQAKLTTKFHIT